MRISDWSSDVCSSDLDTKGRGSASADVAFALVPEGEETRVDITTNLTLSGSVAQYGRSAGMINDLANHIIGQFADNLRKEIGAMAEAQESRASASTRSEEHTSELQSLMRISYAVFCLKKKTSRTLKD